MVLAVLLVALFSEPSPSGRREPLLASFSVVFYRKRQALMVKATELRINSTASHLGFQNFEQNTSHTPLLTVELSVSGFIFCHFNRLSSLALFTNTSTLLQTMEHYFFLLFTGFLPPPQKKLLIKTN